MSTKQGPVQEAAEEQREDPRESAAGVVLRDESDEIIDNLKRQLESLQGQIAEYKATASGGGSALPGGPPPPADLDAVRWNTALVPRLSARLQTPAAELTARLERIIEQVDDPELRAELERCRETAFFLFDTFRQISDNHRLLTDSLADSPLVVELDGLCRMLEHCRGDTATPLAVRPTPGTPRQLKLRSQSLMTIAGKLAGLVARIRSSGSRGDGTQIEPKPLELECIELEFSGPPENTGGSGSLRMRMITQEPWEQLGDPGDVSSVAFRQGATAESVVDLLYVEKIIQLQGGTLDFHYRDGRVHGFSVSIPAEAS